MTQFSRILRVVSEHYNVSKRDILSERRTSTVVLPRQIIMFLAKNLTTMSLPSIGRLMGNRDHTTVLHGIRKIESLVAADSYYTQHFLALTALILEVDDWVDDEVPPPPAITPPPAMMMKPQSHRRTQPYSKPQELVQNHHEFDALVSASKAVAREWCAYQAYNSPTAKSNCLTRLGKNVKTLQSLIPQQI
jgi:Bacterial dnaA protein helix-turn-helix